MKIDEFCQQMKKKTDLARQYNRWTKGAGVRGTVLLTTRPTTPL